MKIRSILIAATAAALLALNFSSPILGGLLHRPSW